MSETLLQTREVKDLLAKVSGLTNDAGNARFKRIIHRVMSDLFGTIEDFDVQPDEFWSAVSYVTALGQANEAGLLVPGLGVEKYLDIRMDAAERKPASSGTPRTIQGPLYVAGARCKRRGATSTMAPTRTRSCSWSAGASLNGKPVAGAVVECCTQNKGGYSFFDRPSPSSTYAAGQNGRRGTIPPPLLLPAGYACPPDGATRNCSKRGRHGNRPAHACALLRE